MTTRRSRRSFLAATGLAALAGCLGAQGGSTTAGGAEQTARPDTDTTAATSSAPGGTTSPTNGSGSPPPTAEHTLPLPLPGSELREEVRSGGPRKDGIPSIDAPSFEAAAAADERLDPGAVVFGVQRGDEVKAYPQRILVWHEVVNDVLGGDPVSVAYCPLTGTTQGFERGETTFGVSGRLLNSNLVMYDRATENWWPQVLSTAIPGPWGTEMAGDSLVEFRVVWTTWGRWRERHPVTRVLTADTGYARNYGRDPYGSYNPKGGYYENTTTLFPRLHQDDRFHPKAIVMGVRTSDGAAAVPKSRLREQGLVEGAIGGTPLVWAYDGGLDTGHAYWNPDGLDLSFDDGTVEASDGRHEPDDLPLDRALTFDAMWFAWAGFYPETTVHG